LVAVFDSLGPNVIQYRGVATPDGGLPLQRINGVTPLERPAAGLAIDYRGSAVQDFVIVSDNPAVNLTTFVENAPTNPGLVPGLVIPFSFAPTSLTGIGKPNWSWIWVGGPSLVGLQVVDLPRSLNGTARSQYVGGGPNSYSHLAAVPAWDTVLGVSYVNGLLVGHRMSLDEVTGSSSIALTRSVAQEGGGNVLLSPTRAVAVGNFRLRSTDPVPALVTASTAGSVNIVPMVFDGGVSGTALLNASVMGQANDVALGDLDGNGTIDLAIALAGPPGLMILWGR